MNWRKITTSSLAMFATPLLFGQLTQSWNSFEKLNSATAGLFYKHEGNITAQAIGGKDFYRFTTFANYSTVSKSGKYGFGVNHLAINGTYLNNSYSFNLTKLNFNRQFVLKNGARLSAGLGIGGTSERAKGPGFGSAYYKPNLFSDLSVAYSTKRFKAGVSMLGTLGNGAIGLGTSLFAAYTFGNEEKLQFTPYAYLGIPNNNFGGTFAYKSKFFLGGGIKDDSNWTPYATVGLRLNNKMQFTYSLDLKQTSSPLGKNPLRNELGFSFQLGKR